MKRRVAVIGAGVSGLTAAVMLAENGYHTAILADEIGPTTTSAAAGAIWFPYDVKPLDAAIRWAFDSYKTFEHLRTEPTSGVAMIELRTFSRTDEISIPDWAHKLGAMPLEPMVASNLASFTSTLDSRATATTDPVFSAGYVMQVPLID